MRSKKNLTRAYQKVVRRVEPDAEILKDRRHRRRHTSFPFQAWLEPESLNANKQEFRRTGYYTSRTSPINYYWRLSIVDLLESCRPLRMTSHPKNFTRLNDMPSWRHFSGYLIEYHVCFTSRTYSYRLDLDRPKLAVSFRWNRTFQERLPPKDSKEFFHPTTNRFSVQRFHVKNLALRR